MAEELPVTCDGCPARSDAGWGDTPLCVDCQRKIDPSLVCETHQLTRVAGEVCPVCKLNDRIDELNGPGAAAALLRRGRRYLAPGRLGEVQS